MKHTRDFFAMYGTTRTSFNTRDLEERLGTAIEPICEIETDSPLPTMTII